MPPAPAPADDAPVDSPSHSHSHSLSLAEVSSSSSPSSFESSFEPSPAAPARADATDTAAADPESAADTSADDDPLACIPDHAPRHEFLLQSEYADIDPVHLVLALRQAIAEFPETKATFKPGDYVSHPQCVRESMLVLLGSWPVPAIYTSTRQRGRKYVNPNSPKRRIYSDVVVRCKCGAVMAREETIHGSALMQGEHEHTDDCVKSWRLRGRAALCDRRWHIIRECYEHRQTRGEMAPRLGLRSTDTVGSTAADLGLDISTLEAESRRRAATTMALLLADHPTERVAAVYGLGAEAVRDNVRRHTPDATTPAALHRLRVARHGQDRSRRPVEAFAPSS